VLICKLLLETLYVDDGLLAKSGEVGVDNGLVES